MSSLGLRLKLFLVFVGLIGLAIASAELYLSDVLDERLTQTTRADLLVRARLVAERVRADGMVETQPDLSEVRQSLEAIRASGVEACAIAFMKRTITERFFSAQERFTVNTVN